MLSTLAAKPRRRTWLGRGQADDRRAHGRLPRGHGRRRRGRRACLLELEDEGERAGVIDSLQKTPQVKDDKFWQGKLQEIAAERVLDNCMAAVVRSPRLVPRAPKPARVPHEPPAYLFLHLPRYFPTTSTPLARDGGG